MVLKLQKGQEMKTGHLLALKRTQVTSERGLNRIEELNLDCKSGSKMSQS